VVHLISSYTFVLVFIQYEDERKRVPLIEYLTYILLLFFVK